MQRILFELKTIRKTFPLLLIFYRKKKFPTIFIYISQEFNLSMQPFLSSSFFDFLKSFILFYYLYIRPIYVYICICVWWNRYLPRCFPISYWEKENLFHSSMSNLEWVIVKQTRVSSSLSQYNSTSNEIHNVMYLYGCGIRFTFNFILFKVTTALRSMVSFVN